MTYAIYDYMCMSHIYEYMNTYMWIYKIWGNAKHISTMESLAFPRQNTKCQKKTPLCILNRYTYIYSKYTIYNIVYIVKMHTHIYSLSKTTVEICIHKMINLSWGKNDINR